MKIDAEVRELLPEWRNWLTRYVQNPVPARACGFESHLRYLFTMATNPLFSSGKYGVSLAAVSFFLSSVRTLS